MKATRSVTTLFAGALLLAIATPASGQIQDNRWLPFIGCWQPAGELDEAGLLCFAPNEQGVQMTSVQAGSVVATEQLVADGQPRPISADGCQGTESVRFSEDGRRAFTRSEITCGDDDRPGTGVMALVTPERWVDVRALGMSGETVSWVQVYQAASAQRLAEEGVSDPTVGLEGPIQAARMIAARDIDVADVLEANATLDTEAVVAWVAAQSDHFELSGDQLLELSDGGVPDRVIDVMVAVSYPEHFQIGAEQAVTAEAAGFTGRRIPMSVGYRSYMMWDPFYSPYGAWGYSPFGRYGYSRFGLSYGYNPYFGLPGYGYPGYGYGGYYGPTIVRIDRVQPESGGRAVYGRGWTRSTSGSSGGRVARPSGGSGSGGYVAPSGSSGGSRPASSSGGRRAKPRGGR